MVISTGCIYHPLIATLPHLISVHKQPQADVFFATARVRTKEHLYILDKLEAVFA